MYERRQQKSTQTPWIRRVITAVFALMTVYLLWADYDLYEKGLQAKEMRDLAEQELNYVTERGETLQSAITKLSTDRGKEAYLRMQYGLGKPGEHLLVMGKKEDASIATETPKTNSWLSSWFEW